MTAGRPRLEDRHLGVRRAEGGREQEPTVVASDKGIAIAPLLGAVNVLLGLFEGNVHVAIDGL